MNDEELEMLESDAEWLDHLEKALRDRLAAEAAADMDAFIYGKGF